MSNSPSNIHPRVEVQELRARYQSEKLLFPDHITSPAHLYKYLDIVEQIEPDSEGNVTDVFVFGKGPAPRADQTRVGGVPFWPANRPWPATASGHPLGFLAQFHFGDSLDLVPDLPGDILLLFVEHQEFWAEPDQDAIQFFWLDSRLDEPRIARSLKSLEIPEFFGALCRIKEPHEMSAPATKIAGTPSYLQYGTELPDAGFLFQLCSIQACPRVAYPWVNQSEPLQVNSGEQGIYAKENSFVMADLGCLYGFWMANQSLYWHFESS